MILMMIMMMMMIGMIMIIPDHSVCHTSFTLIMIMRILMIEIMISMIGMMIDDADWDDDDKKYLVTEG